VHLELGLGPLEERHQHGAHFLARPWCGLAPALVDELAEARRPFGRLEVVELEIGVVEGKLGKDRLVVAQRLARRAELVAEPADESGDLEADRRRPIGLVLHSLPDDPGGLAERQACRPAVRPRRTIARDDRVSRDALGQVEERELTARVDLDPRFPRWSWHTRRLAWRGRQ
jgi:hypothetical protein